MPFSYSSQISAIVGFAEQLRPAAVLDVGVGMGMYGFLLRTNLESVNLFEVDGANARLRDRSEWQIRIDGIEGYAKYITPVHDYAYSNLRIGDALQLLPTIPDASYDLVLAIDIVEHFSKEDARIFIDHCKRVCKGTFLLSTPKDFIEQEVAANPFENHRSFWSEDDLREHGFSSFLPAAQSWIGLFQAAAAK